MENILKNKSLIENMIKDILTIAGIAGALIGAGVTLFILDITNFIPTTTTGIALFFIGVVFYVLFGRK